MQFGENFFLSKTQTRRNQVSIAAAERLHFALFLETRSTRHAVQKVQCSFRIKNSLEKHKLDAIRLVL